YWKIRTELSVEALENIEVESGGHATGIIVRPIDDRRILDQVRAQQETIGWTHLARDVGEQLDRLLARKISDRTAEESNQRRTRDRRKRERRGDIGYHRHHLNVHVVRTELNARVLQKLL